jgi:hypothetical protein
MATDRPYYVQAQGGRRDTGMAVGSPLQGKLEPHRRAGRNQAYGPDGDCPGAMQGTHKSVRAPGLAPPAAPGKVPCEVVFLKSRRNELQHGDL